MCQCSSTMQINPTIQTGSGSKLRLLAVVNEGRAGVNGIVLLEEEVKQYFRIGHFRVDDIWPKSWLSHEKSKNERSLEEC